MTTYILGYTSVGPTSDSGNDGGVLFCNYQHTLVANARLVSLSLYVETVAGQVNLGFYDNSLASVGPHPAPLPLNLIYETGLFTPTTGWNTYTAPGGINVVAGAYWTCFSPTSGGLVARVDLGFGKVAFNAASPGPGGLNNPSVVNGTMGGTFSMYATLDDSVGGGSPVIPNNRRSLLGVGV